MTFNKKYIPAIVSISAGVGLIGAAFLIKENKYLNEKFTSVFKNFYGGIQFLVGYPKGVRNNNPGNIRMTATTWKGEVPLSQNTDGEFKQFYSYVYGVRAAIVNLRAYNQKGYRTVRQIISRWAPPSENKTENYINHVVDYTGFPGNSPIAYNKENVRKLVEAIILKENGKLFLSRSDFNQAWELA